MVTVEPIGVVRSPRVEPVDDGWGDVTASITLDPARFRPDALAGLIDFSHIEVVFVFDRVDPGAVHHASRRPRDNPSWPAVGIFAQRAKDRPNRIGVSVCRLLDVAGLTMTVEGLDAIDGTPVLDIKPYLRELAPRGPVRQPAWSHELMEGYWTARAQAPSAHPAMSPAAPSAPPPTSAPPTLVGTEPCRVADPTVTIAPVLAGDQSELTEAVIASRSLHRPWIDPPDTPGRFGDWLDHLARDDQEAYLVRHQACGRLVGYVNVANIVGRAFRSASLGYGAFSDHAGRGLMTGGLRAVVQTAFDDLGLHRVEANIQPANRRSVALVARCGFKKEGYSPRFLLVDGDWRDHERWALRNE